MATEKTQPQTTTTKSATGHITVPRITIQFCTQCKWDLRATYYAGELVRTFSTSIGEVALLPSTSGTFVIKLYHQASNDNSSHDTTNGNEAEVKVQETTIWDRKVDGGFPETKELKNRVRNVVEPGRGLGHTDRALKKGKEQKAEQDHRETSNGGGKDAEGNAGNVSVGERQEECEDCR
ncbi:uncharacterized protein AB675_4776 [Cyphellophora attinorum]|uniref:Selenoprotein W-like protein n=1 Tax=Cyphellophora attinorum TaxID=1664694 RepID=A0A0N1NYF2_9EURO|nr:uncharacterized protein AB675_4776 [Phialophora attinorum]KPI35607.1 hypothetical protein AB675_4776 [Phialophora attinorum]